MTIKKYWFSLLAIGVTFFSFSQNTYTLEVESFKGSSPKHVLDQMTQYLEVSNKSIKDGVFYFESKKAIPEESIKEIAAATNFTIKEFKLLEDNNQRRRNKNIDKKSSNTDD